MIVIVLPVAEVVAFSFFQRQTLGGSCVVRSLHLGVPLGEMFLVLSLSTPFAWSRHI